MLEAGTLARGVATPHAAPVTGRPLATGALSGGTAGTAAAAAARKAAEKILSGPEFVAHGAKTAKPLAGVLNRLGQWLRDLFDPVGRPFGSAFDWLGRLLGPTGAEVTVGVALAVGAFLVIVIVVRRSARLGRADQLAGTAASPDDPARLERQADEAEQRGDNELAVRLRFRAGLLRLERGGLLTGRETRTSRDIAAILHSPSFSRLATDLEEILYAEMPADETHAEAARTLWPRVPEESASR